MAQADWRKRRIVAVLICACLVGGCAVLPAGCEQWFCREPVYFVGPIESVEEIPLTLDAAMGVELGRFDQVHVLQTRRGKIKFKREIAYHPAFVGWAPTEAFIRHSEFILQTTWPRSETIDFCTPGSDCYRLRVTTDGRFALARTSTRFQDLCELRPNARPLTGECAISGSLRTARGYVMLSHQDGYREFFTAGVSGRWCSVRSQDLYGLCLPGSNALIDPSAAPTLAPSTPER